MRLLPIALPALALFAACDPRPPRIQVTPDSVCAGGTVHVQWDAAEPTTPLAISADQPTTPPLPAGTFQDAHGSMDVNVGEHDTTFTAAVPGGAHVSQTVRVRSGTRTDILHFTGHCVAGGPPVYDPRSISGGGHLLRLNTDATGPVQVIHGSAVIPVPPGGVVLTAPLPPFAGDYQIIVAGPVAPRCEGSSGMPPVVVPDINLVLTSDCPNP